MKADCGSSLKSMFRKILFQNDTGKVMSFKNALEALFE